MCLRQGGVDPLPADDPRRPQVLASLGASQEPKLPIFIVLLNKSGYLSQSVQPLYMGLGDVSRIDRIEVDWPSGQRQTVTRGLKLNRTMRISEPR